MNLLRTIISSSVNKNYYYIGTLFLCYVFLFVSKNFFISLAALNYPGFWIRKYLKKIPKTFQRIMYRMDKWNLFLSTNVLLLDVLTILCRMNIFFEKFISYQSCITINMSNTESVTVLSNLQCKLSFSVLKKSCKNEYNCSSDMCLADIKV